MKYITQKNIVRFCNVEENYPIDKIRRNKTLSAMFKLSKVC